MENDPNEERFKSIEDKLRWLILLAIVQSSVIALLIVCLFIRQFLPSTLSLIVFFAALAVFLYAFRSKIPGWIGNSSRLLFSQMFATRESDSIKDIK